MGGQTPRQGTGARRRRSTLEVRRGPSHPSRGGDLSVSEPVTAPDPVGGPLGGPEVRGARTSPRDLQVGLCPSSTASVEVGLRKRHVGLKVTDSYW